MSCQRERHVWRVPLEVCGIKNYREDDWYDTWVNGRYDDEDDGEEPHPRTLFDWDEFQEEHEELFTWDAGGFSPSLSSGDYIDYVILDRAVHGGFDRYKYADASVFLKILPDLDLDAVHYCSYEWYDGGNAPDMY